MKIHVLLLNERSQIVSESSVESEGSPEELFRLSQNFGEILQELVRNMMERDEGLKSNYRAQ